jgi:hypothetical protein
MVKGEDREFNYFVVIVHIRNGAMSVLETVNAFVEIAMP